jgi:LysR family hydrogen peroxide-inducible transcriptional activator
VNGNLAKSLAILVGLGAGLVESGRRAHLGGVDLSQVTLQQMRYALAVLDTQNFRTAATRANVSQSGLSMQLHKLEVLLDTVLFDRGRQPVLPTPEGIRVLDQMRTILRETERLGRIAADESDPSGAFRLGVIPSLSSSIVPLFLPRFLAKFPKVQLSLEELKTEEMIERIRSDTLEAGIAAIPLESPGVTEMSIGFEPMFAYLPPGDPLLKKAKIQQVELAKRELFVMPEGHCFRTQVLSYCKANPEQHKSRLHFESGNFETLIELIDRGLGATVLPALVARGLDDERKEAQLRPFSGPTPLREIGLITGRLDLRRNVTEALTALLREELSEPLGSAPKRAIVLDPLSKALPA